MDLKKTQPSYNNLARIIYQDLFKIFSQISARVRKALLTRLSIQINSSQSKSNGWFLMIRVIELKTVDNKVESFNKKVKLNKILNSSTEQNEHKLFLHNYLTGTVLSVISSFRKKSLNLYCFVLLFRFIIQMLLWRLKVSISQENNWRVQNRNVG